MKELQKLKNYFPLRETDYLIILKFKDYYKHNNKKISTNLKEKLCNNKNKIEIINLTQTIYLVYIKQNNINYFSLKEIIEKIDTFNTKYYANIITSKNTYKINKDIESTLIYNNKNDEIFNLIKEKQIELHFQPVLNIKQNKLYKYEVLTRLNYNNKLIYPNEFLPIIEGTIYYDMLLEFIIEKVVEILKNEDIILSINVFYEDIINEKMFNIFQKHKLKNKSIKEIYNKLSIELLEQHKININNNFIQKLKKIKDLGIKIALDDFGTGYNNYSLLKKFNFNCIKIDGTFVQDVDKNKMNEIIIKSVVDISSINSFKTVTEFVETKEELIKIKELNVDCVQGYYISKPLKFEEAIKLKEKDFSYLFE